MDRRSLISHAAALTLGAVLPQDVAAPEAVPNDSCTFRTAESFGAVGDGTADDTDALLEAVEWERKESGRALVVLRGGRAYRVRQTLRFDFDHGGLLCLDGAASVNFNMNAGNGIEVFDPSTTEAHVSGSWFRGVYLYHRGRIDGHAWYYRRASFGHVNEDCGAPGGWGHCFHYDNSCFGNNLLARPHLEMGRMAGIGIWIGAICNGLHVVHPEINNPRIGAIEIDATRRSDIGEGPGVNSVVLDHVMTHNCGEWHLRLNGAYATRISSPRLEASASEAPLVVLGDDGHCENITMDAAWLQGSGSARVGLEVGDVTGFTLLEPAFYNLAGPAMDLRPPILGRGPSGVAVIHPVRAGTTGPLFADGDARGATVLSLDGDVIPAPGAGLVLRDEEDGRLRRVTSRGGRLLVEPVSR